ncbi:FmdB family zinc ribbon protein [Variovorax sp. OV329]|uniref:FmdB family zinc ribbon protein n=1 Tax=Variovorax sp. OV329 TaxID=1882825 RepID=UPI000B87C96E|nr:FmdB family zinc ribbon protein [Variovorax sp. OV329]
MPLYDYACAGCGRFSATRPLQQFDQPAPCPACGDMAPRALTVPALLGRAAHRNDAQRDDGQVRLRHVASSGCSCCPR